MEDQCKFQRRECNRAGAITSLLGEWIGTSKVINISPGGALRIWMCHQMVGTTNMSIAATADMIAKERLPWPPDVAGTKPKHLIEYDWMIVPWSRNPISHPELRVFSMVEQEDRQ